MVSLEFEANNCQESATLIQHLTHSTILRSEPIAMMQIIAELL
jgi:hypothetical protein